MAKRMGELIGVAAFVLMSGVASLASAQGLDRQRSYCLRANGESVMERVVSACTAVISNTRASKRDISIAYNNRGNAYRVGYGDFDRAIADYDQAIQTDPAYAEAYNNRGNAYRAAGDSGRAMADYDHALRLDPQFLEAHYNRGLAHVALGDYAHAVSDYDRALHIDPRFARALNSRCRARAIWGEQLHLAVEDCTAALRLRPNDPRALENRGLAHLRSGEFAAALADYDASLRGDPQSNRSLYGRGIAHLRLGHAEQGHADIAAAGTSGPNIAIEFSSYGLSPE